MKKSSKYVILILSAFLTVASAIHARGFEKITAADLDKILNTADDRLYVINFWATWCPPCVRELPHFEKAAAEFSGPKVRFILVSLDFPSEVDKKLLPFIEKHKITIPVYALMETDAGKWMEKADSNWQGAIPATLFLNNARKIRKFHEGELDENQLRSIIKPLI